ncbi:hypothetical protein Tco_1237975 [Tanacetum coccineum]
MDRLSKRKFGIVCHEKVVRIPLEGDEVLRVHGERTQGVVKTLMNTKVGESKLSDISVVRDFIDVFPEDLSMTTAMTKEEHEVHLKLELELLRKEKLYAKGIAPAGNAARDLKTNGKDEADDVERVKPRRVREMAMSIQYRVRGYDFGAQSEAFKQENIREKGLNAVRLTRKKKEDENIRKEWNLGDDQLRFRWMIYLVVLADAAESVSDAIRFEYCLASSNGWTKSPVLWAEIGESSLTGLELVQETTDKVVLIKEKLKAARNHQKSYVDYRRKPLEFEVGDQVILRVSPWKGVMRLRLPEELNSVHDTFYVSNLKKCLADANLHVPLNEIKVDKTLRFVEEPVEIMDREIRKLKRRKVGLVKVRWNSKRGPKFTWEHEDQMRINYPQLFVDRVVEPAS